MKTKGYHKLRVVKEEKILVKSIYQHTDGFPKSELYGLTSQIRRASVSVLLNTVEGHRRKSNKEFWRFLEIADASCAEVEVCLELATELEFLKNTEYESIENQRRLVASMLTSLMKKVQETF